MSEAPKPAEPDLHAIFGMDGERGDPVISVDRPPEEPGIEAAADAAPEDFGEFDSERLDEAAIELDVETGYTEQTAEQRRLGERAAAPSPDRAPSRASRAGLASRVPPREAPRHGS